MENLIKMDDLGGPPLFLETSICFLKFAFFSKIHSRDVRVGQDGSPRTLAKARRTISQKQPTFRF